MAAEEVAARLGPPASAAILESRGGYPSREEIEQLLDPAARRFAGPAVEAASAMNEDATPPWRPTTSKR